LECFAIAVQLAPDAPSARVRFAEQLALCGRFDDARAQYAAAGLPLQEAANPLVERAARGHWPADSAITRKLLSAAAGKRHGMIKRSNKFIRNARGTMVLAEPDGKKVIKNFLPNGL